MFDDIFIKKTPIPGFFDRPLESLCRYSTLFSELLISVFLFGYSNGNPSVIDLNAPITRRLRDAAKQKAIEYVRKHGPIGPLAKQALKRKSLMRDSPESPAKMLRECESSEEFQKRYEEMKNMKSINDHLVDDFQNQQRNKYFAKLEVKEKMEKQLMESSKLPCKAVQCLRCNYTSYSASDSCKKDRHPLRVFDTFKRFFKCKSCSKRTVTLDEVIPTSRCSSCNSQSWEHTSVIEGKIIQEPLLIRGHELKFIK